MDVAHIRSLVNSVRGCLSLRVFIGGAWAVVVAGGMTALAAYETRPGAAPAVADSSVRTEVSDRPTLMLFVHPRCPCSVATVKNLADLLSRCDIRPHVRVLVYQPSDKPDSWSDTGLVREIRTLPGVTVELDRDASLAKKMGARTSGQGLLFDRTGRLQFSGGITPSRGHVGDNDGTETIVSLINRPETESETIAVTPVFGCGLYQCVNDARNNR